MQCKCKDGRLLHSTPTPQLKVENPPHSINESLINILRKA